MQEHHNQMELVKLICCRDTKTKANQQLKKKNQESSYNLKLLLSNLAVIQFYHCTHLSSITLHSYLVRLATTTTVSSQNCGGPKKQRLERTEMAFLTYLQVPQIREWQLKFYSLCHYTDAKNWSWSWSKQIIWTQKYTSATQKASTN